MLQRKSRNHSCYNIDIDIALDFSAWSTARGREMFTKNKNMFSLQMNLSRFPDPEYRYCWAQQTGAGGLKVSTGVMAILLQVFSATSITNIILHEGGLSYLLHIFSHVGEVSVMSVFRTQTDRRVTRLTPVIFSPLLDSNNFVVVKIWV